jgi:hypothetical protein
MMVFPAGLAAAWAGILGYEENEWRDVIQEKADW